MPLTLASNAVTFTDNTTLSSGIISTAQLSAGAVTADKLATSVQTLLVPVGAVMSFALSSVPTGWLPCNGASLTTSAYPTLFSAIRYTYGGSGSNFSIPDLRGEFVRGWDAGRGVDDVVGGRIFGSQQRSTLIINNDDTDGYYGAIWNNLFFNQTTRNTAGFEYQGTEIDPIINPLTINNLAGASNNPTVNTTFGGIPNRWIYGIRPRNVALQYCIKWN